MRVRISFDNSIEKSVFPNKLGPKALDLKFLKVSMIIIALILIIACPLEFLKMNMLQERIVIIEDVAFASDYGRNPKVIGLELRIDGEIFKLYDEYIVFDKGNGVIRDRDYMYYELKGREELKEEITVQYVQDILPLHERPFRILGISTKNERLINGESSIRIWKEEIIDNTIVLLIVFFILLVIYLLRRFIRITIG